MRSGSTVKKNLKFFVYGNSGTWKSTFGMNFARMVSEEDKPLKVLYIDTEGGSIDNYLEDLEDDGIDTENILIAYTAVYDEVVEILETAKNEEPFYVEDEETGEEVEKLDADGNMFVADAIVIDSATILQDTIKYSMIGTSEKRARLRAMKNDKATASEVSVAVDTAGMEFKDYDKLNHKGKKLLRDLVTTTDKYICVISREKDRKEQIKDVSGGNTSFKSIKVGVMPDCFKGAEYEFYTVLHMIEEESTGQVQAVVERKDRTKMFKRNEVIDNPSIELWQPIIDGNKDKKETVITESFDSAIEKQETAMESKRIENTNVAEKEKVWKEFALLIKGFSPDQKKEASARWKENKLPVKPSKELDAEVLAEMIEVAKKEAKKEVKEEVKKEAKKD